MEADAAGYLEACPAGSFDGFTLSNILDGAPEGYRERLFAAVKRAAAPGQRRGAAELRRAPASRVEGNWPAFDRSMLWGVVEARAARDL